jgi:hypothetical protein
MIGHNDKKPVFHHSWQQKQRKRFLYFCCSELEFLKRLWGLGTEEEEGYRTGPPGYIGWRNSFLGIDSGAPYTFKNTSSGCQHFSIMNHIFPLSSVAKISICTAVCINNALFGPVKSFIYFPAKNFGTKLFLLQ